MHMLCQAAEFVVQHAFRQFRAGFRAFPAQFTQFDQFQQSSGDTERPVCDHKLPKLRGQAKVRKLGGQSKGTE